jgi:hypothetical protein
MRLPGLRFLPSYISKRQLVIREWFCTWLPPTKKIKFGENLLPEPPKLNKHGCEQQIRQGDRLPGHFRRQLPFAPFGHPGQPTVTTLPGPRRHPLSLPHTLLDNFRSEISISSSPLVSLLNYGSPNDPSNNWPRRDPQKEACLVLQFTPRRRIKHV